LASSGGTNGQAVYGEGVNAGADVGRQLLQHGAHSAQPSRSIMCLASSRRPKSYRSGFEPQPAISIEIGLERGRPLVFVPAAAEELSGCPVRSRSPTERNPAPVRGEIMDRHHRAPTRDVAEREDSWIPCPDHFPPSLAELRAFRAIPDGALLFRQSSRVDLVVAEKVRPLICGGNPGGALQRINQWSGVFPGDSESQVLVGTEVEQHVHATDLVVLLDRISLHIRLSQEHGVSAPP